MKWTRDAILARLKKLAKQKQSLAYSAVKKTELSLLSAAAYHFGSYAKAVEEAGVWYRDQMRRPRWTKQTVIAAVKKARKKGVELNWASVARRRDELGKAARASISKRLFGSWARTLQASGVDPDEVAVYRKWDKPSIAFDLRLRAQDDEPMNSAALQKDDPGLHAAALRHYGSLADALKAARVDAEAAAVRHRWTKAEVLAGLKKALRGKARPSLVRTSDPKLHGAARRLFGSFKKAVAAAK